MVLATACSQSADPSPAPPLPPSTTTPSTSTAPPSTTSTATARPTVPPTASRTLNVSKFAGHTCDSLTPQQVATLGLGGLERLDATTRCRWSQGRTTFDIDLYPDKNTLVLPYQESADHNRAAVFEPFEIRGFPALKRQISPDRRHSSDCNISVALGQDRGIYIAGFGWDTSVDWCAKSVAAAEFVIQNLGG
ncbi:DUF3558 family protein [Kibdelosporangium aridum]|uniref:DUF3558 family protein n=1 Tax=Kibdelosporangium aridum TaxID=2030 RepID=UPI0035E98437